jgi:hypothetical protein
VNQIRHLVDVRRDGVRDDVSVAGRAGRDEAERIGSDRRLIEQVGSTMDNRVMIYEMADAIERERRMAGASRNRRMERHDRVRPSAPVVGLRRAIGAALVRAGMALQAGHPPRPEPAHR